MNRAKLLRGQGMLSFDVLLVENAFQAPRKIFLYRDDSRDSKVTGFVPSKNKESHALHHDTGERAVQCNVDALCVLHVHGSVDYDYVCCGVEVAVNESVYGVKAGTMVYAYHVTEVNVYPATCDDNVTAENEVKCTCVCLENVKEDFDQDNNQHNVLEYVPLVAVKVKFHATLCVAETKVLSMFHVILLYR